MKKTHKGLFHLNRQRRVKPLELEESELFLCLERVPEKSIKAATRIVDQLIDEIEDGTGEYDWARLSSLLGYKGTVRKKDESIFWNMCGKAVKDHETAVKKLAGLFVMWRFAHRDGWFAYVQDTGKYDKISEKEITITCYFRRK